MSALWAMFGHWQLLVGLLVLALLGAAYAYVKPFADLVAKAAGVVLDFLKTQAGKIALAVAIVTGGLYWGCVTIWQMGYDTAAAEAKAAAEKELKRQRERIAQMAIDNANAGKLVDERLRAKDAARAERTITITKEVTKYVPATADARCLVPRGFVWLHESARGVPTSPAPAGAAIEEPSTVTLSDLARDDARTVELYDACRDQVAETQRWYGDLRERYATMRGAE